jgi:diguanylate cyclase (GGDEF)-like protein/PAS domain S-box-containing protein
MAHRQYQLGLRSPKGKLKAIDPSIPNALFVGARMLSVTVLIGVSSWLAIALTRPAGGVTIIWVASGLLTGLLLTSSYRLWLAYILAGLAGNLIARAVFGDSILEVTIRALASTYESCVVAYALRHWVGDITDSVNFPKASRVGMISTAFACLTSALIVAAAGLYSHGIGSFSSTAVGWFASHALGIVVVATVFVVARNRGIGSIGRSGHRWNLALVACLVATTTLLVFSQSRYPFLFLIFPPLLLAVFRHRFDGAAIGITVVAVISLGATLSGYGPLYAISNSSPQERILLLQLFIATLCLATFPVVVVLSERGRLASDLRNSEQNYRTLADYSRDIVVRMRPDGHRLYVSPSVTEVLGWEPGELIDPRWDLVHPDDLTMFVNTIAELYETGDPTTVIYRAKHKDGHYVWIEAQARRVPSAQPDQPAEIIYAGRDISRRMDAEQQLRRSEQRLHTIADAMPAMIGYADLKQRFVFVNAAYERCYRRSQSELIGLTLREVLGDVVYAKRQPYIKRALRGEQVTFEDEQPTADDYRCMEVTYIPQRDDQGKQVLGLHVMAQDITRKKLQERRLVQAAEVDSLTGLANRAGFFAQLDRALARNRNQHAMLAVMYLDIDHFKQINDTHGHGVGDAILKAFAERLSAVLRTSDTIGRLGGDEFTVITEGVRRLQYVTVVAAKIVTAMRRPFVLSVEKLTLSLTTSVGLALSVDEPNMTATALLERADGALYMAKAAGRDGYRVAEAHFPEDVLGAGQTPQ